MSECTYTHTFTGVAERVPGKWYCTFDTLSHQEGRESYLAFQCESGTVWATKEQAEEAGPRAVAEITKTGMWPNLCEKW